MSVHALFPSINNANSATMEDQLMPLKPPGAMQRAPSMLRTTQFHKASTRRQSFLDDLQEQMLQHQQDDLDRERQKEVLNLHRILQRPPDIRDANDIDTLYEWVMRNGSTNKIFQGAQEIICKTICREMTLLELPAKGIVCYQGDYGDVFFIIVTGSVSLYVETKKKLLPAHTHNCNNNNSTNSGSSEDDRLRAERYHHPQQLHRRNSNDDDDDQQSGELKPEIFGSFIKQIGSGGTFGELAVMDPTARRSCTIICDAATSFICLKRAAYQRLIRITNSSQLDFTQVEFLETLYFFDRWPHSELMRVSNRLRHMTFAADSFLARIGSEANMVFFIYSGIVQESVPLVHHLNENGQIHKCTTLESDSALRSAMDDLTLANRKQQQLRRRVALELNLCREHDVCGEFPIVFNHAVSTTDLLAVTDVKALILDRETWKEIFFMHGLDHVKGSHRRFRQLALARENWRQTRLKLALANPGIRLTISTKAMMQDGKCMCGWCGSSDHITGDASCSALMASKQRQADKQKKKDAEKASPGKKPHKGGAGAAGVGTGSGDGITSRAHVIKNTLTFVNQIAEMQQDRKATATAMGLSGGAVAPAQDIRPITPHTPSSSSSPRTTTPRQSALKQIAHKILGDLSTSSHAQPLQAQQSPVDMNTAIPATPPSSLSPETVDIFAPVTRVKASASFSPSRPLSDSSIACEKEQPPSPASPFPCRVASPSSQPTATTNPNAHGRAPGNHLFDVFQALGTSHPPTEPSPAQAPHPSSIKIEDVRKGTFTEEISTQYRHELIHKTKKISTVAQYYETRSQVLETIQQKEGRAAEDLPKLLPRKPKIPKPSRRLAMLSKTREPRPDRFNRKINRLLTKMWIKDHPVPTVEESLQ